MQPGWRQQENKPHLFHHLGNVAGGLGVPLTLGCVQRGGVASAQLLHGLSNDRHPVRQRPVGVCVCVRLVCVCVCAERGVEGVGA